MRAICYRVSLWLWAVLLVAACLCPDLAIAADPFSLIFGEDTSTSSRSAHEDDLVLVGIDLRDQKVVDIASAYRTADGLCLEASIVFETLELPFAMSDDQLIGHADALNIDLKDANAWPESWSEWSTKLTPQGWCLTLPTLKSLTDIDFIYDEETLTIVATPETVLPVEARLERARLREAALAETQTSRPDFPLVEMPYEWVSAPTFDVLLTSDTRSTSGLRPTINVDAAADFLKMTAQARLVDEGEGAFRFRGALSRTNEWATELGPLKARHFSMGHISAPVLPLLSRSVTGLGAVITNSAEYQSDQFDETEIVGRLPLGWEAELYRDNQLLAFTDQPDANGNYRFQHVPLLVGYNRLTVKLYGPYGEEDQHIFKRFVGGAQCPDGQWRYTVAVINPDGTRRGDKASSDLLETAKLSQADKDAILMATIEHGLSKHLSVRVDGQADLQGGTSRVATTLIASMEEMHGGVRLATDGSGIPAVEGFFQRRLGERSSLSAHWTEYGNLQTALAGTGEGRLVREGRARFETQLGRRFGYLPLRNSISWYERANGETGLSASTFSSLNWRGTNLSHGLSYTRTGLGQDLEGSLIASRTVRGTRLRGGLSYGVEDGFEVKSLSLSGQRDLSRNMRLQSSATYDMDSHAYALDTGLTRQFRQFTATTNVGLDSQNGWFMGATLAFSLHKPTRESYRFAPPGLSRTGGLHLQTFIDANNDGIFDASEIAVPKSRYIVDNSLRADEAGADGIATISGLDPHRGIDVELQLSSLDDPFLKPQATGRRVSVRPGRVASVVIPLLPTGDIDGTIMLLREGFTSALAGAPIEIVDANGVVQQTVVSEYDGYFYADGIVAGDYTLRVAPEHLLAAGASAEPIEITLTASEPSLMGLDLLVRTDPKKG